jgi:hypothetical protein
VIRLTFHHHGSSKNALESTLLSADLSLATAEIIGAALLVGGIHHGVFHQAQAQGVSLQKAGHLCHQITVQSFFRVVGEIARQLCGSEQNVLVQWFLL